MKCLKQKPDEAIACNVRGRLEHISALLDTTKPVQGRSLNRAVAEARAELRALIEFFPKTSA